MKRCPTCQRLESDEALKFCRVDGATLVADSAAIAGEAGTVPLAAPTETSEVHTSMLPHRTGAHINRVTSTAVLTPEPPAPATQQLAKRSSSKTVIAIAALVLLIAVAIGGYSLAGRFGAARGCELGY